MQHPRTQHFHHRMPRRRKTTLVKKMCTAVRQQRNNGAPGEDGIQEEVYKTCLDSLGPWLNWMITKGWLCEAVPNNWSEVILLPLFK